jgi:hypothetical protein
VEINNTTYPLLENNFRKEVYQKTQIVVGGSGRKDMRHYYGWINRRNGNYKKTATYTIDKDGKIYEHYDPKYYSDFLGCEQDKCNISVVLVNEGWLKLNEMNVFVDWLGHTYSKNNGLLEKNWRNHKYWVKYTDEQFDSLKYLIEYLCNQFHIQYDFMGHNVYDENADIFKGVTFRSNYFKDITDVSPAFDLEKIK